MNRRRIAVITAGHLATCPRMVKAADALAERGHDVHVVSTRSTPWATDADRSVRERRRDRWRWSIVDYANDSAPATYVRSGVRHKIARAVAGYRSTPSFSLAARALCRVHDEIVRAALATEADFFYGGTVGGVGAAFEAARRAGCEYALDLEDFYSGNRPDDPSLARLIERVETEILGGGRFLTAASDGIGDAYRERYGVEPVTIHNTFSLPERRPEIAASGDSLRLYWFSQTIGPGRGLEDAVEAMRRAGIPGELHLRGRSEPDFARRLDGLAANAPALRLVLHPPAPPDDMVTLLESYDVGLALEQGRSVNNRIALSNKAFTYVLGGLALVMTQTEGHRPLIEALKDSLVVYAPGDVDALATGLSLLAADPGFLERCRRASWEVAERRWHWEHAEERGRLLRLFE